MNNKLDAYNERRKHEKYRKQARKRWAEAEATLATIRTLPCHNCGTPGPSEAHHLIPKSKWTKTQKRNDEHNTHNNLIPLCHTCHQNHHTTTKRIPQHKLAPSQRIHILRHTNQNWLNLWYPQTTSHPTPQCNNQCNCANPQTCEFNNENQN